MIRKSDRISIGSSWSSIPRSFGYIGNGGSSDLFFRDEILSFRFSLESPLEVGGSELELWVFTIFTMRNNKIIFCIICHSNLDSGMG